MWKTQIKNILLLQYLNYGLIDPLMQFYFGFSSVFYFELW